MTRPASLAANGAKSARHVFRYDLSPLLPQLRDEVEQVPVIETEDRIRFVDAPRRYRVPLVLRVRYDGQSFEETATLVLDKRGLQCVESSDEGRDGPQP